VHARWRCTWRANMLQMQLVEIGQAFGGRDHSTVIHSVDKVERQMNARPDVQRARGRWHGRNLVRTVTNKRVGNIVGCGLRDNDADFRKAPTVPTVRHIM